MAAGPSRAAHLTLAAHPTTPAPAVRSLTADVWPAKAGRLRVRFTLQGDISLLHVPLPVAAMRRDELWRHTCFEAFVAPASGTAYREFNLSPSAEWAVYDFEAYRVHAALRPDAAPACKISTTLTAVTLDADLPLDVLAGRPARLGLSAVVESVGGVLSYWALAHTGPRPDFHRAESFVHLLS